MSHLCRCAMVFYIIFLTGCSQKFADTTDTLTEAFWGFDDIELPSEQIAQLLYASMYVRINGGHQIFMVLALAERNKETGNIQLKWLSADKSMIVTENGRIVKTLLFPDANLAHVSSKQVTSPSSHAQKTWSATYDWQPNYQFGRKAHITSKTLGTEQIESVLWTKKTEHIQETMMFDHMDHPLINDYWVDTHGEVVKSAEWVVPDKLFIELEILKPYSN